MPMADKPRGKHSAVFLAHFTTPSTVARKFWWSNHILRIITAFPKGSPSLTVLIHISAVLTSSHNFIEWVDMNPLCCWPFFTLNYWASGVETTSIWSSIWEETKEKKCISSTRFHCALPGWERGRKIFIEYRLTRRNCATIKEEGTRKSSYMP